jgi:hypothetical protein
VKRTCYECGDPAEFYTCDPETKKPQRYRTRAGDMVPEAWCAKHFPRAWHPSKVARIVDTRRGPW